MQGTSGWQLQSALTSLKWLAGEPHPILPYPCPVQPHRTLPTLTLDFSAPVCLPAPASTFPPARLGWHCHFAALYATNAVQTFLRIGVLSLLAIIPPPIDAFLLFVCEHHLSIHRVLTRESKRGCARTCMLHLHMATLEDPSFFEIVCFAQDLRKEAP